MWTGTFGRGGHARAVLAMLGPAGKLVAFDKDPEAVAAAAQISDARFVMVHANFGDMTAELSGLGIAQVDGVLLDLGISSPQIDDPARAASAFATTRRWTCAWTPHAAKRQLSTWPAPMCATSKE